MYFSGGLIPTYLVVNNLHLTNTFFAFRLDGICQVNFKIIRREVRVKQSDKLFFPVALI